MTSVFNRLRSDNLPRFLIVSIQYIWRREGTGKVRVDRYFAEILNEFSAFFFGNIVKKIWWQDRIRRTIFISALT